MLPDTPSTAPRPEFWEGLAAGRFRLPRCARCAMWHAPGARSCEGCGGALGWHETSGEGTVYSLMERHAPEASDGALTYAVIALDAGPRMMALVRPLHGTLRVGDRVRARAGAEPPEGLPEFVRLTSE